MILLILKLIVHAVPHESRSTYTKSVSIMYLSVVRFSLLV